MRLVIAAVQGIDVERRVATLARAIDLEARVIAPAVRVELAEIGLAVATCQAVLEVAASSMVRDPAAAVPAPVAIEVLPAWVVRVGAMAEVAVEEAAVLVEEEEAVLVEVGDGNRRC